MGCIHATPLHKLPTFWITLGRHKDVLWNLSEAIKSQHMGHSCSGGYMLANLQPPCSGPKALMTGVMSSLPHFLQCHCHWQCHRLCSTSVGLSPSRLWFLFICHGSLYPMTSLSFFMPHDDLLISSFCFYKVPYDIVVATTYSWGIREQCHHRCVLYNIRLMWPLAKCISGCSVWTPKPQLGVLQLSPVGLPLAPSLWRCV